jgi:hypothetical protein
MKITKDWSDINVGQFQEYQKTLGEEPSNALEEQDLLERRAMALTGFDWDQLGQLTMKQLYAINNIPKTDIKGKLKKRIKVAGRRYRVILDPTKEESLRYKMVMNACKEKDVQLHRLMFSVCVPINWMGKDQDLKPYEVQERLNEFKSMPMTIANPIVVFFCAVSENLTNVILQFSNNKMKEMNKIVTTEIDSIKNMAG